MIEGYDLPDSYKRLLAAQQANLADPIALEARRVEMVQAAEKQRVKRKYVRKLPKVV